MLYERQFQTEFYRCAIGLLGGSYGYCSPEVGHIFGANGFLGFYIDTDLKWGVELVRGSDKLQEHSDKFKPGGKYKNIPMEEYAILNFVYKENLKGAKRLKVPCFQNEWLIFYDRVNPFLIIRRIGEETKHISLIGDEI